jgi:hypothetical protein
MEEAMNGLRTSESNIWLFADFIGEFLPDKTDSPSDIRRCISRNLRALSRRTWGGEEIMGNTSELARPITMQHGMFDGIAVYGNLFDENGKRFWILDMVIESPEQYSEPTTRCYWVCRGDFRTVREGRLATEHPFTSTFRLDEVVDPPPAEKLAALKAIDLWEKHFLQRFPTIHRGW